MIEEASWNPASGCYQCPINVSLDKSWAGINPLPGFADIGRGYFSVPLTAPYLPLPFSESDYFGSEYFDTEYVICEVGNAHVGKFFAICAHERWHIALLSLAVKGLISLAASRAHQAVFNIISENNNRAWEELQQWNLILTKLTKSIALVEELIATLLGCAEFKEKKSELHHQVEADRIEEDFIQAQSKLFGPDFVEIYGQLADIFHEFGSVPLAILTAYSMDWVEVERFGEWEGIPVHKINEETSRSRLYKCLEMLNSLRHLPEAHHWTRDDWDNFFDRWLLDFRRWRANRQELRRFLARELALCQKWWADRGFKGYDNPAVSVEQIASQPKELVMMTVRGPPFEFTEDAPLQQRVQKKLNERARLASDKNRTVVVLASPPNTISLVFVPFFDKDNQGATPFTCLTNSERPPRPPKERLIDNLILRESLSTLLFFEGLRQIFITGCGVRCPVRCMEWAERACARIDGNKLPTCCGRSKEIIAFWEAGNKPNLPGSLEKSFTYVRCCHVKRR
jgi:hypothetical protein